MDCLTIWTMISFDIIRLILLNTDTASEEKEKKTDTEKAEHEKLIHVRTCTSRHAPFCHPRKYSHFNINKEGKDNSLAVKPVVTLVTFYHEII